MYHVNAETTFRDIGERTDEGGRRDDYFLQSQKTARVIHNTLGLQKVKNNSISDSVAAGLWAAALKPVKVTE